MLLEIGCEELPSADLNAAMRQLRTSLPGLLDELRLEYSGLQILATPRRLVVSIDELAPRQKDLEQVVKGPPAERAFDADGQPTRAAIGFAGSRGVEVEDLVVQEMDGGRYVTALVRETGRPALEVLADSLPELISSLKFERAMRWNHTNVTFSRPIRWLLALYGEEVIPFSYAGLQSGRTTRGLRFREQETITVTSREAYHQALQAQGIILDPQQRKALIKQRVQELAAEVDGVVPEDPALLEEVTNLVEAPTPLRGEFERDYLQLPREVLVSVMRKHQRYFPIQQDERMGMPLRRYFITVRNGDEHKLEVVRQGNEDVIRARFADASYFVQADQQRPLEDYLPDLALLTFQKELGSMLDKTERITGLVGDLAGMLSLTEADLHTARRAARLCKADLATSMVVEMTSLQGIMGRYYALQSGEPEAVAEAIFEHYLPRFAGDSLPASRAGLAVGIADRLDTLAGLFAVGLAPTGAKDPFALRRTALGLVLAMVDWDLDVDLERGLRLAGEHLPERADADELDDCLTFIVERQRNLLLEEVYSHDVIDAVLVEQGENPAGVARNVRALSVWVARPDWERILPAYARCVRITRDLDQTYPVVPEAFVQQEEKALCQAIKAAKLVKRQPGSVDDFLTAFVPMIPVINRFFDEVLVMADDPGQRANRLGMLQMIANMAHGVADFSRLEGF